MTLVNITRCPKCGKEGLTWLTTPAGPVLEEAKGVLHVCKTVEELI